MLCMHRKHLLCSFRWGHRNGIHHQSALRCRRNRHTATEQSHAVYYFLREQVCHAIRHNHYIRFFPKSKASRPFLLPLYDHLLLKSFDTPQPCPYHCGQGRQQCNKHHTIVNRLKILFSLFVTTFLFYCILILYKYPIYPSIVIFLCS